MNAVHFYVPGPLERPTGGSRYDHRVITGLRGRGQNVAVVELDGRFPIADATAKRCVDQALSALPDAARVIVDGLVFGALPESFARHAERVSLIALVHHPLADETGLAPATRERLQTAEAQALALAKGVIATSAFTARRLAELGLYRGRVEVVPPGCEAQEPAHGRLETSGCWQLLCIGSLIPRKAQRVLVEALAGIRALPWRCEIIGSTELDSAYAATVRHRIEALGLGDRILLRGAVDEPALQRAYTAADIFVLPSVYEGYGMVVSEAIAHALPIVTTTGGALPTTLPEAAGIAVTPGDAAALAQALERIMTDAAVASGLREAARAARKRLIGWEARVQRFQQALEIIDNAA